ncbi:MAG: class I SAM-dependent methyltransferase [Gammaproteobacteria bacterium]|nr:class I SAM-dependent methyltransferase [Gammaproteobacteria bacterium]
MAIEEPLELQETIYSSKNPTRRWIHQTRRDWIVRMLRSLTSVERSLEIGPGSGIYLPVLAERSHQVLAADIEQAYLKHAQEMQQQLPNLECVHDDITHTRLQPGSFDLILCSEVIEHIADSLAALQGAELLLADDGVMVLSTPQRYCPLEVCAKIAFLPGIIQVVCWIYGEAVEDTGHINLLTEKELKRQLTVAGLEVDTEYKSGFYLPLVAEFCGQPGLRLLRWLEGILRDTPLSGLLWTQYYVLRKRPSSPVQA